MKSSSKACQGIGLSGLFFLVFGFTACKPGLEVSAYLKEFLLAGLENGAVVDFPMPVTVTALNNNGGGRCWSASAARFWSRRPAHKLR